jgi:hypothetical protein
MCVKLLTSLVCVFVCIKHKLMVYTQALFFSFFMLLNDSNFLIQYSSWRQTSMLLHRPILRSSEPNG